MIMMIGTLMSKLLKFLFLVLLMGFIGGFVYFAFIDVPITQEDVSKETTLDAIKKSADNNE